MYKERGIKIAKEVAELECEPWSPDFKSYSLSSVINDSQQFCRLRMGEIDGQMGNSKSISLFTQYIIFFNFKLLNFFWMQKSPTPRKKTITTQRILEKYFKRKTITLKLLEDDIDLLIFF